MKLAATERLLLIVLALAVGGSLLLLSAPNIVEDGHRPWRPGSVLHLVTRLMNFDYQYPTPKGVTVKQLAFGLGSAAILGIASVAWLGRVRRGEEILPPSESGAIAPAAAKRPWYEALPATDSAQLTLLGLVVWSFASAMWSAWPTVACGESALLAMGVAWAIGLGRTLSRRGATAGAFVLVALLAATAAVGVWYYYERNSLQRLKFPIGNPLFLAACLLPGLLLAAHLAAGAVQAAIQTRRRGPLLVAAVCLASLVPMAWAFVLTNSRGAAIGLAFGLWAMLMFKLRGYARMVLGIALVIGLFVGYRYVQRHVNDLENGRGATIRLRLYGWRYAWRMFLQQPVVGAGQGGYAMAADSFSRADAEADPHAFPGPRIGNAHNEWLETLANLGAVGIALAALGYGLTFREGRQVPARLADPLQRWCSVGLLASLAALMAEEATNVALRAPGLPPVWYTVLGLTWAMMRRDENAERRPRVLPRLVRNTAVAGGGALAAVFALWSAGNWRAALAEATVPSLLRQQKWTAAEVAATAATRHRLSEGEVVDAAFLKFETHVQIAEFHLHALIEAAQEQRLSLAGETPAAALQRQDLDTARTHVLAAREDANALLSAIPDYPYAAGRLGELLGLWLPVEMKLIAELPADRFEGIRQESRALLLREYLRNRLDATAALRVVSAWSDQAVGHRIDCLRTGLRGGAMPAEYRDALYALGEDKDFDGAFGERLRAAGASLSAPGIEMWSDPFAPETLRLAALIFEMQGRPADAAQAAGDAARLYQEIYTAHPTLLSIALAEQAHYLFLASPDEPARAQAACREALAAVPPFGSRDRLAAPIREALCVYSLAEGKESEAAAIIVELTDAREPGAVMRRMGEYYAELAMMFLGRPRESRPARFSLWRTRAVALAPDTGAAQVLRAQVAFEDERDDEFVDALARAESLGVFAEQIDAVLARALAVRPESKPLREMADRRGVVPATRPTTTMPATGPASAPATAPS